MGKTYRRSSEEGLNRKKPKNHNHSNNKKLGGMRIINMYEEELFDDEVEMQDNLIINKSSDEHL